MNTYITFSRVFPRCRHSDASSLSRITMPPFFRLVRADFRTLDFICVGCRPQHKPSAVANAVMPEFLQPRLSVCSSSAASSPLENDGLSFSSPRFSPSRRPFETVPLVLEREDQTGYGHWMASKHLFYSESTEYFPSSLMTQPEDP